MMDYYYTESFTYDLQGNIKTLERWVYSLDEPISEGLLQRTQYYPSGLPWNEGYSPSEQPYKYGGKEFVEMHGLDEYDSEARWYYPAIMRTTTMDPLCEQYYDTSPYVWCGNNPVNNVDPTGMDWYKNDSTQYITWFNEKKDYTGYTYLGEAGSVLGEFEPMIDNILQQMKVGGLYDEEFTFDIVPTDKGALLGSKERDWDFLDEFVFNEGPEFSVFLENHPYTQQMKNDTKVQIGQNKVREKQSFIQEHRKWTPGSVLNPCNWKMARQFIGSYVYYGQPSVNGKYINNVIYDSKSVSSLFLHIPNESMNKRRSEYTNRFGNTYQFYIWKSPK